MSPESQERRWLELAGMPAPKPAKSSSWRAHFQLGCLVMMAVGYMLLLLGAEEEERREMRPKPAERYCRP